MVQMWGRSLRVVPELLEVGAGLEASPRCPNGRSGPLQRACTLLDRVLSRAGR